MDSIPDEILLRIFEFIQPKFPSSLNPSNVFENSHSPETPRIARNASLKPTILVLGWVNQQCRRVSLMHSVWKQISWHLIIPAWSSKKSTRLNCLDEGFRIFWGENQRLARVDRIELNMIPHQTYISDLILEWLLKSTPNPKSLRDVVLYLPWSSISSYSLRLIAKRFRNLQTLCIRGIDTFSSSALYGISSKTVEYMAQHMHRLETLMIQSYGTCSFSWESLLKLISGNPDLSHLCITGGLKDICLGDVWAPSRSRFKRIQLHATLDYTQPDRPYLYIPIVYDWSFLSTNVCESVLFTSDFDPRHESFIRASLLLYESPLKNVIPEGWKMHSSDDPGFLMTPD